MLVDQQGASLIEEPLSVRRAALESFFAVARNPSLRLSPVTSQRAEAETWLAKVGSAIDGVIDPGPRNRGGPRTGIRVRADSGRR